MGKKYTASPIVKSVWQGRSRSVPKPRPLKKQKESSDWNTLDKEMVITSEYEDGDHSSRYCQVLAITIVYLLG